MSAELDFIFGSDRPAREGWCEHGSATPECDVCDREHLAACVGAECAECTEIREGMNAA